MAKKKSKSVTITPFIKKITTIHGVSHFSSLRGRAAWLWSAVILANVILTLAFILVIKEKFNENQIVTQINSNCKVSQVPFPAVSICNFNLVSLRESSNIAEILKTHNRSEKEIKAFFNALPQLKNYNKNSRNVGNFTDIMNVLKGHYYTMETIMEEVHQKCDSLLLYCSFNRKVMNCDNIFTLTKTYEGHCCTFNYAALNDGSEAPILPADGDLEFYNDPNEVGTAQSGSIISTSESGSSSGLQVILNVEPDDYPSWSDVSYYGAKVMMTDPNDYPETTILYRYISPGEAVDIKMDALLFQCDENIRRVDPHKRGCWFYDEVTLEYTDRYSYETCNTECRMKTYLESCGCIPYKYPKGKSNRVCEIEDLKCLNNVTVYKSKKEMDCKPVCFQECRDKKYSVTSNLLPLTSAERALAGLLNKHNLSNLADLQVYFSKSNCNCYKAKLLIDVNYFIATYGGVFSLCFGGSILTICEVAYLFMSAAIKVLFKGIKNTFKRN